MRRNPHVYLGWPHLYTLAPQILKVGGRSAQRWVRCDSSIAPALFYDQIPHVERHAEDNPILSELQSTTPISTQHHETIDVEIDVRFREWGSRASGIVRSGYARRL
jgi:hypothetical protein